MRIICVTIRTTRRKTRLAFVHHPIEGEQYSTDESRHFKYNN